MKKTLLLLLFLPFFSFAQTDLVVWNGTTDLAPSVKSSYVISKNLTGAGLTTGPTPSNDGIIGTGWPTANTIDTGKYFQIEIGQILDGKFTLDEIKFTYKGDSKAFQVRYSKQANFSSPTTLITETNAASNNTPTAVTLSNLGIVVNGGEKVYIRFYAYTGGNWKLMNNDLLKIRGTINTVPSPLNGTYKIGSATDANFPTITSAVNALNTVGVSGAVTFLLDNTIYNPSTNEVFPIRIDPYTGNETYKVTFKPNTGRTVSIESSVVNFVYPQAVFKLDGVDNVVFDGSNNSTTTNNLTIYNNNTSNLNRAVIWIASQNATNGANNIEVKNLTLQQYSKGSYDYSIGVFSGDTNTTNLPSVAVAANSNNTVSNVTFSKVGQGVYVSGSSNTSLLSTNWKIQNNTIGGTATADKPYVGFNLSNAKNYEVSGNKIAGILKADNQTATDSHAGIYISGSNSTGKIFNNYIQDVNNTANNSCSAIFIDSGNNTIYNNIISNIYSAKIGHGIYINSGDANKVYYNTIVMNNNSNPANSSCLYINGGTNIGIKNNIFYNSQTNGTQYLINSAVSQTAITELNYNNYYSANAAVKLGRLVATDYANLTDWKAALSASGKEVNSIAVQPNFISASDFHLSQTTVNSGLHAKGNTIAAIATDIDGDPRASTPDMGADEIFYCEQGDQITYGNGSWIGYTYKWTGTPAPTTYIGYVTENAVFDRNVGAGAVSGDTTIICGTPPTDNFMTRYLMKATTTAETYNITFGADDGVRLYIDGNLVPVTPANSWSDHSYVSYSAQYTFTAGTHNFVLEYYENAGSSRVSFSYGAVKGDPSVYGDNKWNVYGYTLADISLPAASYAGTYVDNNLNINTQTFWDRTKSPSYTTGWQGAPMNVDQFAIAYKRQGFPCGRYQIQLVNCDDVAEIYIDGTKVFTQSGYTNTVALINGGQQYSLNKNSKVDVRLREDAGDANLAINFIDVPFSYDGSTAPPTNSSIIINSDYTLTNDLQVCSCTVAAGKTFTIATDKVLTVLENVTVNATGKIVVQNSGSLVQTNNNSTYTGSSTSFELNRNTTPINRFDYTYWSSPVINQTLYNLSPTTLYDKYLEFDSSINNWKYLNGGNYVMQPGKGYIVRGPQSYAAIGNPQIYTGKFIGQPNNGIITTPVTNKVGNLTTTNLLGNPYPSALSADQFYADNSSVIKGTFYLWTHAITPVPNANGQFVYNDSNYISYNATGSTGAGDFTNCPTCGGNKLTGNIASGQGFFVEAKTTGNVVFNNALRVTTTASNNQFSRTAKTAIEKNRVWLNIKNSDGAYNEMLLGYVTGATNELDDAYDGNSYASGTALYTVLGENNLVIQGRALPFDEKKEIIPLGYIASTTTDYTIAIESVDGSFQGKNIYLLDKTNNVVTDLSAGNYTFTTEPGMFNDRFVLTFYKKPTETETPPVVTDPKDPSTDTPVVTDPTKDPTTDTPVVTDPKDPSTDTPVVTDPKDPSTDTPVVTDPKDPSTDTPVVTDPKDPSTDTPVVTDPKDPTTDTPVVTDPKDPSTDTPVVTDPKDPTTDTPIVTEPGGNPGPDNPTLEVPDTPEITKKEIIIYQSNNQILIESDLVNIESVYVFDLLGKNIFNKENIHNTSFNTNQLSIQNQMIIVRVKTEDNKIITKKVIF
jgi:hypothetical protein